MELNEQVPIEAEALVASGRIHRTRVIEVEPPLRPQAASHLTKRDHARLPAFQGRGGLVHGVNPLSTKDLLKALGDDA